jgi:Lrp/AsnC family leucine-responsive transcriptional regulator
MLTDDKDLLILQKLQEDMTKSYKTIADELDMPATTVYNRVKKMEENSVILGYKPIIDSTKLGFPTTCYLLITLRFKDSNNHPLDIRKVAQEIADDPYVQETHIVAGDWDLMVKMKTENVQKVGDFINQKLRYIEGVEKSLSCIVFGTIKETLDLPLGG